VLTLRFLNVGHGDCTFVDLQSGRLMMIDINNSKSLSDADIEALAEHKGISVKSFRSEGLFTYYWEQRYQQRLVDPYDYYQEHFRGRSVFRYMQTHPDMDHMGGVLQGNLLLPEEAVRRWPVTSSRQRTMGGKRATTRTRSRPCPPTW
jgi:competence protein ComEC